MAKTNGIFLRECFRGILRPYRWRMVLICALTVLQSLLQVFMALLSRFVIDAALEAGNLAFWGAVLLADMLLLVGNHSLLSWYTGSTADRLAAKLRQDILRSAVYCNDTQLQQYHSGELLSRGMEDVYTVCDGAVSALPALVGQVVRLTATFAAVLFLYPPVAGVLLCVAVVVGVATACLRPVIKAKHRAVRQTDEKVMAAMQENLQQLELIQSLDAQKQILQRFDRRIWQNLRARFQRRLWSVGSSSMLNTASQVGSGVLLLWGVSRIATGVMSYGTLTAMLQLLALFRGPVLGLSGLFTRLAGVEVALERLRHLLKAPVCVTQKKQEQKLRAIVFENVTFTYPGETAPVVKDFSFRIPLDGWTCLTGISGKGKTTLFKLVLGLYNPQSGRVYLETADGQLPCSAETRSLFAYVPQDYALLSGTILENLLLVAPDADEQKLRQALSVARADFVWELGNKEQAQLRENNTGLSKGQLQRLAIARAILMDRPVFLLDECTSALDGETEKTVLQNLKALDKQTVLVTHRPEALEGLEHITSVSMEK